MGEIASPPEIFDDFIPTARQQKIYVGKHGDDSSAGSIPDQPKLTIASAITQAGTPASEADAVTIYVLDDGTYTENLTGVHTLGPNQNWSIRHAESSTGDTVFDRSQAGTGGTFVSVDRLTLSGTGSPTWGFNCQSDRMVARVGHVVMTNLALLGAASGAGHELILDVGHVQMTAGAGTCIGLMPVSDGKVIAKIGWLEGDANSTGITITTGEVDAVIGRLECGTAYNVSAGKTLRLTCSVLLGTATAASGADVLIRDAGKQLAALRSDYLVGPAGMAKYDTIQVAIDQAVTDGHDHSDPATVWIFPGSYTENLSSAPGINLAALVQALPSKASVPIPSVEIVGTMTYAHDDAGATVHELNLRGIKIVPASGSALTMSGTAKKKVFLWDAHLEAVDADVVTYGTASEQVEAYKSRLITADASSSVAMHSRLLARHLLCFCMALCWLILRR
jgi:hypothetical protein